MKKYLSLLGFLFLASFTSVAQKSAKAIQKQNDTKKPNIIFIMSD